MKCRAAPSSAPRPALAELLRCVGIYRFLGTRPQRGCAPEHQQLLAAIDAGERRAGHAREHLAALALECPYTSPGQARRLRAITTTGDQPVADSDVGSPANDPQLGPAAR